MTANENIKNELELIGLPNDREFTLKEAKRAFRRKSHVLLPEKSLGTQNAHSRFEELNTAFVTIVNQLKENGEDVEEVLPGEVDVRKAQFVINLKKGSVPYWRRVIKSTYPTVIVGAQKKNNFIQGGQGKGVRFVVYWKAGADGTSQPVKVNLILYENDLLQVTGSGFFLWAMDNYHELVKKVDESISDSQRSEDEGCITEDYSDSRSGGINRGDREDKDYTVRCKEPTCESDEKFGTIIEYLENMEEGISEKCKDIKAYIDNLESGFNEQLENLTKALDENEKRYIVDNKETQGKLNSMNEKIFETRQIIGASAAPKMAGVVKNKMKSENIPRSPRLNHAPPKSLKKNTDRESSPKKNSSKPRSPRKSKRESLELPSEQPRIISSALSSVSSEEQPQRERGRNRSPKKRERKVKKENSPSHIKTNKLSSADSCEIIDQEEEEKEGYTAETETESKFEENKNIDDESYSLKKEDIEEENHDTIDVKEADTVDTPIEETPILQEDISPKQDCDETFDQTDGSSVSLDV